jgi:ribosomal protein L7/L12
MELDNSPLFFSTMKLKITTEEAVILIKRALNLPADIEVTITKAPTGVIKVFKSLVSQIEALNYQCSSKIQAIKIFREVTFSGLAEAKWAIENWATYKAWVLKNKRWPKFGGSYNNFTLE